MIQVSVMSPTEFIETIYLGDRAIKKICIDGWGNSVKIEVNEISRIRSADGLWNFYKDEDIENGEIVTLGVQEFSIEPRGVIPNDYIASIACKMVNESTFNLVIEAASVTSDGESRLATVSIVASGLHLIDPKYPDRPVCS